MAITNAVLAHNTNKSRSTKYKPVDLFFNNDENISKEVIKNISDSQKNINKNRHILDIDIKFIISDYYDKKGNTINIKFNKKGKRNIPGIIVGKGSGYYYPIRITKDYKDLKKDNVYDIDYRLVKEVNENVYNTILNFNEDIEPSEESDIIN